MKMFFFWLGVMWLCVACFQEAPQVAYQELPTGNAEAGAALFQEGLSGAAPCATCHTLNGLPSTGPSLQGYASRAEAQSDDLSAGDYTYQSIIRPSKNVVRGFSNLMPTNYEEVLTTQQLADLVAFLLTLT
jgi:mono/diheme cytochrome c family protein